MNSTYYDVDEDIMYYACLEHSELWFIILLIIIAYELIKYFICKLK